MGLLSVIRTQQTFGSPHTRSHEPEKKENRKNSSVCNMIIRWLIVVGELVSESSIDCRLYM